MSEQYQFAADTGKILDIVIDSLYSQKEIFLRELVSNASDAISKRQFDSLQGAAAGSFDGMISIAVDKKAKCLTITDNGIGLNDEDLKNTLGTIASSGTKAFLEQMEQSGEKSNSQSQLIGQFGVGFYAAFMVAERVEVLSKKSDSNNAFCWASDGKSGFAISPADKQETGTQITLFLKSDAKEFLEEARISHLIKKYSDHISFPINWLDKDGELKRLNASTALWTKPAKDISEDDYKSFYNSVSASYDAPFATLHNKTEGVVEFTNLLFIPSVAPYDLYDPDRKSKLQLYVNRVFITDQCDELVPKWMRFLRGVIDTPDVNLNVSREMLQHSPVITKIRKSLVKRVLSELKKSIEKRRDAYQNFWDGFGRVVKEGIYEDAENRAKILEVSFFKSAKSSTMLTLDEYIDAFAEGQEEIYYLSVEDPALASGSPHLEGFEAKGVDVLILSDPVDDFWLANTPDYKGKTFRSISRGDVDLTAIKSADGKDTDDDQKDTDETKSADTAVAKIKDVLSARVADVKPSKNLAKSVARLIADENAMDAQMERFMRMHDADFKGAPKILEVNAKHPLIAALNDRLAKGDFAEADDFAELIYQSALISDGKQVDDPHAFAEKLAKVMQKAL
ncbi:MAG: molecular chaperone HtpG [Alphaproteobacteria bacterium]